MNESVTDLIELWLTNDEGIYSDLRELYTARTQCSDLRDYVQDILLRDASRDSGMLGDLVQYCMGAADWESLHESMRDAFDLCEACMSSRTGRTKRTTPTETT